MIRQYNPSDITIINELSEYNFSTNPFNHCLVYELDSKIVGFLDYSIMYDKVEINYIFVLKKYRNQKIASQLLEVMFNEIKTLDNVTLEVSVLNENALNLYKKFGFKQVAIRKNYYKDIDAYLMERRLP